MDTKVQSTNNDPADRIQPRYIVASSAATGSGKLTPSLPRVIVLDVKKLRINFRERILRMFGSRKTQQNPPVPSPSSQNQPATGQPQTPRQPIGFETVLGANSTMKGELKSQANVRLDGTFEGGLQIDGNVLVGETA